MNENKKNKLTEYTKYASMMNQSPNKDLGVTQKYDRHNYDKSSAHTKFKEKAFENKQGKINKTVKDANGKQVYLKENDAIARYGVKKGRAITANADHIDALVSIHNRHRNNPFITNNDIKKVANRESNFQVLSASENKRKQGSNDFLDGLKEKNLKKASTGLKSRTETDVRLTLSATKTAGAEFVDGAVNTLCDTSIPLALDVISEINAGEKTLEEITAELGKEAVDITLHGGCNKLVLQVVYSELKNSNNAIIKKIYQIDKNNKIAAATTAFIVSASRYMSGKIDEDEFINEIGESGTSLLTGIVVGAVKEKIGTLIGGEAGALLLGTSVASGPLFAAGMIIGAGITIYENLKGSLDAFNSQINQTIRELDTVLYVMDEVYSTFEKDVTAYYQNWDDVVTDGFNALFNGVKNNDFRAMSNGLDNILSLFGEKVVLHDTNQVREALKHNYIIEM